MKEKIEVKINKDFATYRTGQIVNVKTCNNIPLSKFWRDRIRDSKYDDCVTIIKPAAKKPATTTSDSEG